MDYKKNELPEFLDKLKSVIVEMERAIIGRGKYELCKQFKKMEKTEDEWFRKMTFAQRQAHMKRLSSLAVGSKVKAPLLNSLSKPSQSVEPSNKQCCSRQLFPQSHPSRDSLHKLSVSVDEFSDSVSIPSDVLNAIWNKAGELLSDSKAICMVPGGHCKDRIVKRSSSPTPHVIVTKKSGQFACDDKCPNW